MKTQQGLYCWPTSRYQPYKYRMPWKCNNVFSLIWLLSQKYFVNLGTSMRPENCFSLYYLRVINIGLLLSFASCFIFRTKKIINISKIEITSEIRINIITYFQRVHNKCQFYGAIWHFIPTKITTQTTHFHHLYSAVSVPRAEVKAFSSICTQKCRFQSYNCNHLLMKAKG